MSDFVSSSVPTQFACGRDHTILIGDSGRFYGFGNGQSGQFGQVKGLKQFQAAELQFGVIHASSAQNGNGGGTNAENTPTGTQVAVGSLHTLILKDGSVYSFGEGSLGRLGLSKSYGKTEGRLVFNGAQEDKIGFITCGPDHSIAVSQDGYSLYAWGSCDRRGVGHPAKSRMEQPGTLLGETDDTDEDDEEGGDGDAGEMFLKLPTRFVCWRAEPKEQHRIIQVSCGAQHTLALREDGVVYSWGDGANGRLGHKGCESLREPTSMSAFNKSEYERVIQVCAGASHSMALDLEGKVWTWGSCNYGKLGHAELEKTLRDVLIPQQVLGLTRDAKEGVVSIHCNQYHSLAITNTHRLLIWGGNQYQRLGLGDPGEEGRHRWYPHEVMLSEKIIRAVCGLNHTVAVTEAGHVYTWGQSSSFKCGIPPKKGQSNFSSPVRIGYFDGLGIMKYFKESTRSFAPRSYVPSAIAVGESHSLVLCDSNQLVAFGNNSSGQLGTGVQTHSDRPIPLAPFIEPHVSIRMIACGAAHSLCLTSAGQIYSFGDNSYGQLGLSHGENTRIPLPIKSLATSHIDSISVGANTCACIERVTIGRQTENRIFVWGNNEYGQAGLGPKVKKQNHPVPLLDLPVALRTFDRIDLAIGTHHMLALAKNFDRDKPESGLLIKSRLYSVGRGTNGQLGIQTSSSNLTYNFVKVNTFEGYSEILRGNENLLDPHRARREKRLSRVRLAAKQAFDEMKKKKGVKFDQADEEAEVARVQQEEQFEYLLRDRIITESDYEYEDELQLEKEYEAKHGKEGTKVEQDRAREQAALEAQQRKAAGAYDMYPHINLISAGEFGSLISIQRFHNKSMDFVFAWGKQPGLWNEKPAGGTGAVSGGASSSSSAATPSHQVLDQLLPRYVPSFDNDNIKKELDSKEPIFDLRIQQVVCAKSHCFILAIYNAKLSAPVVFTFGDSTFGKLGVGNVEKYLSDKLQQRRLMSSGGGGDDGLLENAKYLAPSKLPGLSTGIPLVQCLAAFSDHSLALAPGSVFSWGVVDQGRLGLSSAVASTDPTSTLNGIAQGERTVPEPRSISAFVSSEESNGGGGRGGGGGGGKAGPGYQGVPIIQQGIPGAAPPGFGGPQAAGGFAQSNTGGGFASNIGVQQQSSTGSNKSGSATPGLGVTGKKSKAASGTATPAVGGTSSGNAAAKAAGILAASGASTSSGAAAMDDATSPGAVVGGHPSGGRSVSPGSSSSSSSTVSIISTPLNIPTSLLGQNGVYSKVLLQQRENEIKQRISPLAAAYLKELQTYDTHRTLLDRQKDLLHLMILERLNQSQAAGDSITKSQAAIRAEEEKMREKQRIAQEKAKAKAEKKTAKKNNGAAPINPEAIELISKPESDSSSSSSSSSKPSPAAAAPISDHDVNPSEKLAHSSELTSLEECLARFYLRPCLLYHFFSSCSRQIDANAYQKDKLANAKTQKQQDDWFRELEEDCAALKQDGCDLVYAVYDLYYDRDSRYLQVFLRLMLEKHVTELNRSELILHHDKIEWNVFVRAFKSGPQRRVLGDILAQSIQKLRDYDKSPASLLYTYASSGTKDPNDVRIAMKKIREKGDELITIFCQEPSPIKEILLCLSPYINILYDALQKSNHKDSRIFSAALLSVMMEVALTDMPYQFEKTLREKAVERGRKREAAQSSKKSSTNASGTNTPGGRSRNDSRKGSVLQRLGVNDGPQFSGPQQKGKGGASSAFLDDSDDPEGAAEEKAEQSRYESNKLVLLNLYDQRYLKEYMMVKYKVEPGVVEQTVDGGKSEGRSAGGAGGGGGAKDSSSSSSSGGNDDLDQTLTRLKVYHTKLGEIISGYKVDDPNLGSYDKTKVELERELYADFVTVRSKCYRRVTQCTKSSLKTLARFVSTLFNPLEDISIQHKMREVLDFTDSFTSDDSTRINIRHDVYNVDRFAKVKKCQECSCMHPYQHQLELGGRRTKQVVDQGLVSNNGSNAGGAQSIGGSVLKPVSHNLIEEDFRMPTEDCLCLWSVLNEPEVRSIIETKAGQAAWKDVTDKLDELTSRYKSGIYKNDQLSDRYLLAKKDFTSYARACDPRNIFLNKKRILIYFGSETHSYIEASTIEPINLFTHLTQMSTSLQVEYISNYNKSATVDSILQVMLNEQQRQNQIDSCMIREYKQLHSDIPCRSALTDLALKKVIETERREFEPEKLEEHTNEINVFIDTKGHLYEFSYGELVSKKILNKTVTDPSRYSVLPLSCIPTVCCRPCQANDTVHLALFLKNIKFVWNTGQPESHLIEFTLVHTNTSKLYTRMMNLHDLASDSTEGTSFEYDPRGDMVEIQEKVNFVFEKKALYEFLRVMSRPRLYHAGAGLGSVTGLELLGFDSSKF